MLLVVVAVVGYAFIMGIVHRLLERGRPRLMRGFEDLFSTLWPIIPAFYVAWGVLWAVERVGSRIVRAGRAVPDLPGRLAARWRRRGLHDDCAAAWAWTLAGGSHPTGPCDGCVRLIGKRVGRELPRAEVRQ